jgi:hypothetical protein
MENQVFCLYDNKVDAFMLPFFASNETMAKSSIAIAFIDEDDGEFSDINSADYELFHLGEYHFVSGKFETFEAPKHLCNCKTLIPKDNTDG